MASLVVLGTKHVEQRLTRQYNGPLWSVSTGARHPRAHVHLAAIGAAQGGLISIVGTADLSLEDYAVLLLRLIGSG